MYLGGYKSGGLVIKGEVGGGTHFYQFGEPVTVINLAEGDTTQEDSDKIGRFILGVSVAYYLKYIGLEVSYHYMWYNKQTGIGFYNPFYRDTGRVMLSLNIRYSIIP